MITALVYITVFLKTFFKGFFDFFKMIQGTKRIFKNSEKITLLHSLIIFQSINFNQKKIYFSVLYLNLFFLSLSFLLQGIVSMDIAYCMEADISGDEDADMMSDSDELVETIIHEIEMNLYINRIITNQNSPFFYNYYAGAPYTSIPQNNMPQILSNITNEMGAIPAKVIDIFNFIKPSEIVLNNPSLTTREYLEIFSELNIHLKVFIQIQSLTFIKVLPLYYNYLLHNVYTEEFFNICFQNSVNNSDIDTTNTNTRVLPTEIRQNIVAFIIHPYMENYIECNQRFYNFLANSLQIIQNNTLYLNSLEDNDAIILVEEEEDNSLNFSPTEQIRYNNIPTHNINRQYYYYRNILIESNYQQDALYRNSSLHFQRNNQDQGTFSIVRY